MTPREDLILRLPAVLARVGLSRTKIYKLMRIRAFPAGLKLAGPGGRAIGWRASEIDTWIAERRNATEAARRA